MDIHEYQAKSILRNYGISVPSFVVAATREEVVNALRELGVSQAVVKIQVHAGGRGKAGGVRLARSPEEITKAAEQLIGMRLVNNQTGSQGVVANQVLISPLLDYSKEYYIGAVIDRQNAQGMMILSPEGGMEIEEIAEKHPHKILRMPIPINGKFRSYQMIQMLKFMGWFQDESLAKQGKELISRLGHAFVETDASLLEINPLVLTNDKQLVALDAKLSVDDNALFRQKQISAFYDPSQVPANEAQAKEFDLAYVALDGDIGCMVNGAGLAMATMDLISLHGGRAANFLDVGGGASEDKVAEGFKIILSDPQVKAILVNIFGGIMNCETLAAGIIAAAKQLKVKVPLIVRMEGTNVEQGKALLAASGLNITIAHGLTEAANKVVESAKVGQR